MMPRSGLTAAALLATLIVSVAPRFALNVGTTTPATVKAGQNITIPIVLDMSGASGANVASISFDLTWDSAKLSLVSGTGNPASGFTLVDNKSKANSGVIRTAGFTVSGVTTTRALYTLVLAAKRTTVNATTSVTASVMVGGDNRGKYITIVPRNLTVNITP